MVDQKPLFRAAKNVGVGRVIPSDFGTVAPRGVMAVHDLVLPLPPSLSNAKMELETRRP